MQVNVPVVWASGGPAAARGSQGLGATGGPTEVGWHTDQTWPAEAQCASGVHQQHHLARSTPEASNHCCY